MHFQARVELAKSRPAQLDMVTFDYAPDIFLPAHYPQIQQRAAGVLALSFEVFLHQQTDEIFFVLSSAEHKKGANMIMSAFYHIMLAHKCSAHEGAGATALAVQTDRGLENVCFGSLSMTNAAMVDVGWYKSTLRSALLVGHTHCPVDQVGGTGRQAIKRLTCVNTLVDVVRALKASHQNRPVSVIFVKSSHDWVTFFEKLKPTQFSGYTNVLQFRTFPNPDPTGVPLTQYRDWAESQEFWTGSGGQRHGAPLQIWNSRLDAKELPQPIPAQPLYEEEKFAKVCGGIRKHYQFMSSDQVSQWETVLSEGSLSSMIHVVEDSVCDDPTRPGQLGFVQDIDPSGVERREFIRVIDLLPSELWKIPTHANNAPSALAPTRLDEGTEYLWS